MTVIAVCVGLSLCVVGCGKKSESEGGSKPAEEKPVEKPQPVDFELTADNFSKEYIADPAGTDKKYATKKLRVSGGIKEVFIAGDKAFVRLDGAYFTESTKLGEMRKADSVPTSGSFDITCNTKPDSYVKMMAPIAEKALAAGGSKLPAGMIEGTYDKGFPVARENPAAQMTACRLVEPKK